jgi:hypothetical protein
MTRISLLFALTLPLFAGLAMCNRAVAQETPVLQRIEDQEFWISNNQLYSVLSLDYQVEPQQGWLVIQDNGNRFYVQSNELFPELRMTQAWANTVNITMEELNGLNSRLSCGRLFLTEENKLQLVYEHSYHGMKISSLGLTKSIERFRTVRDLVVEMIANL